MEIYSIHRTQEGGVNSKVAKKTIKPLLIKSKTNHNSVQAGSRVKIT